MSRKPGYAAIASHYRHLISDGTLAPGDPMPSLNDVCDEFGVSITTANRAFRLLKSEGLTLGRAGVGTVVADRSHVAVTAAARLDRIARTGKLYARGETSVDHEVMLRSCNDPDTADYLDVEIGDEILIRKRVFLHNEGERAVVASSYIQLRALIDVPELRQDKPFKRFWQEIYTERTGRKVQRSPERRTARLATDDELAALGIDAPPGSAVAVLVLLNIFHDDRGPIEVWEDVYAPGLWQVDAK